MPYNPWRGGWEPHDDNHPTMISIREGTENARILAEMAEREERNRISPAEKHSRDLRAQEAEKIRERERAVDAAVREMEKRLAQRERDAKQKEAKAFDPYNAKDSAREIARLTRLLGEATIRNAELLEVVVAVTAEADEATAAARQASNLSEDERAEFKHTISELQQVCGGLRLRANVAEDTTKHYAERAEAAEAKARAMEHQITDYQLQLAVEQSNHRSAANHVGKLKESEKANQKRIADLEARVKELRQMNDNGGAQ